MDDNKQSEQIQISKQNEAAESKKIFTTGTSIAGTGLVLLILGRLFSWAGGNLSYLGKGSLILALPALIIGCSRMAKGKGYHMAWGLLGFLSLPGLIILYFLPNRIKSSEAEEIKQDSYDDQVAESIKKTKIALLIVFTVIVAVAIWTWYVLKYKY